MKYGVIFFKETENIGDDIQTYAAIRRLPSVDYYIERENLDLFIPSKKEVVTTLMSGWFLHDKYTFFPSPYINPIFISTHFSAYTTHGIKDEYISLNKDYLRKYAPIGCRDKSTQEILNKYQIESYYSGCITLTLDRFRCSKLDNKYICAVDISDDSLKYVKDNSKYEV